MKCPACSAENADGLDRCLSCGSILSNTSPTNGAASPPRMSRLAVASALLGILTLPTFIIGALPTLIISLVAIVRIDRSAGKLRGRGLAIVGLALSLVGILNTLGFLVLTPALRRVRNQAKATACMANLRQWGTFFYMYAGDYDGNFMEGPFGSSEGHNGWIKALSPYHKWDTSRTFCPSATRPFRDMFGNVLADTSQWSTAAWGYVQLEGWEKPMAGSYGINGWCYNPEPGHGHRKPEENYWRTQSIKAAASVPLFLGAKRSDVWPRETDEPLAYEDDPWLHDGDMSYVSLKRHEGSSNCLFLDFSVRGVDPKEVYTLAWHRTYNTAGPWTAAGGAIEEDWPQWIQGRGGAARLGSLSRAEMTWVKCMKCGASYQIRLKYYYEELHEKARANPTPTPLGHPLTCQKCGQDAVGKAVKCENCGEVFLEHSVAGDFPDRCPKCKHSATEAKLKARVAEQQQ